MSERHQDLLHRFVDGRLASDEADEWKALCAESPELHADAEDFAQIGTILREQFSAAAEEADFAGFMDGISAQLAEEHTPVGPSPADGARDTPQQTEPGLVDTLKAWWSKNWTPVLVSAAAAAAVSLWVSLGSKDEATQVNDNAVLVDAVSNEGNKTVLISMPSDTGDSTIIWLLEEEEDDQATLGEDPI